MGQLRPLGTRSICCSEARAVTIKALLAPRSVAVLGASERASVGRGIVDALERIDWNFYAHPRGSDDESLEAIHGRMRRWLGRMLRRHAGSEVVAISHGDPILILAGTLQGLPLVAADPAE